MILLSNQMCCTRPPHVSASTMFWISRYMHRPNTLLIDERFSWNQRGDELPRNMVEFGLRKLLNDAQHYHLSYVIVLNIEAEVAGARLNTNLESIWFCERLTWNPAESPVCDVSRQLSVLHQAASHHKREIQLCSRKFCKQVLAFFLSTKDVSTRIEIVKLHYSLGESVTAAFRGYKTKHGLIKDPFTVSTIARLLQNLSPLDLYWIFLAKGESL
ncbi:hypothetical protein CSKR_114383 [Clonorchis sinensis]|uniref:Uncharacterized protein n=1 Tax=Clonorchis sinensis TaxID=79923 RepID=A0A3R7CI63_CLOSI|nr:hypothetical protein CSKR_114383 [Clonorchis sinensis]